jgi:hypothetical protein
MSRTAATPHSAHDELLIARLYAGDVDVREREHALEMVSGCEDCAALFADLAAIAEATAALPVPRRPRDFALTQEDAARLRPRRGRAARLLGMGRRRSFGGALVALGFAGVVATSALSLLSGVGTSTALDLAQQDGRFAAQATSAPAVPAYNNASGNPVPAPSTAPVAVAASSAGVGTAAETVPPTAGPTSLAAHDQTTTSSTLAPAGGVAGAGTGTLPPDAQGSIKTPIQATTQPGPDARLLVLLGSAAVLVIGLAVLLLPMIRRRTRGGPSH